MYLVTDIKPQFYPAYFQAIKQFVTGTARVVVPAHRLKFDFRQGGYRKALRVGEGKEAEWECQQLDRQKVVEFTWSWLQERKVALEEDSYVMTYIQEETADYCLKFVHRAKLQFVVLTSRTECVQEGEAQFWQFAKEMTAGLQPAQALKLIISGISEPFYTKIEKQLNERFKAEHQIQTKLKVFRQFASKEFKGAMLLSLPEVSKDTGNLHDKNRVPFEL